MVSSFEFEFRTSNRSVPNQEVYRACILLDNSASRRRRGLPSGDPTRRVQLEGWAHHLTQSKTLTDVPSPRERGKDMSSGKRPSKATLQRIDQLPEMHRSKRLCCTSGDQRSWLRNGNKPEGAVAQIVEAILPYESSRMKSHPPLCRPARRDSDLEVASNPGLTPLGSTHTVPPCGTREEPVHCVKRFCSSIPGSMVLSSH
jgi:hypothetical protein